MPTDTITVRRVVPYAVGYPPVVYEKFLIDTARDGFPSQQYSTFDPLVASLCDQAIKQGFPVAVTWRETRFGREIIRSGARRAEDAA